MLHIDRHSCTTAPAVKHSAACGASSAVVRNRNLNFAVVDHILSTLPGRTGESHPPGIERIHALRNNCREFSVAIYHVDSPRQGIAHVMAPEAPGAALEQARDPQITVDLERCVVQGLDSREISFAVPAGRRTALLAALDEVDVILGMESEIENFQRVDREQRPWIYLDRQ